MSRREETPEPLGILDEDRSWSERVFLAWDLGIVALVLVNLALIIIDTLYVIGPFASAAQSIWPAGARWYDTTIHQHFFTIDLFFVALFVLDVLAGWTLAIIERRYHRWYFYPFVHWYDVLGCIPVAGLRFLRILRVISALVRLQRLGVIEIRQWWLYRQVMFWYDIAVEEISDRVVIKVLTGAQDELRSGGNALSRRVMREVVAPRKTQLTEAVSSQLEKAVVAAYRDNREEMQAYVASIVHRAVEQNPALKNLERVPMLGAFVSEALDEAIRDTVNHVLDESVDGLTSPAFDTLVAHVVDSVIERLLNEPGDQASDEVRDAVIETLELIKDQVAIKRWHAYFE